MCAGRGAALALCKGPSRRAPKAQSDAAEALEIQRMLRGPLPAAHHVLSLKGCFLLACGGPAPGALVVPAQASQGLDEPRYLCVSPKKAIGVHCLQVYPDLVGGCSNPSLLPFGARLLLIPLGQGLLGAGTSYQFTQL